MSAGAFSIPLIVRERILDFMSWVLLAVISYTLTAGIAISDKYFLTRRMPSAVSYGFWVGVLGLGFVLAIPFGFYLPEPQTLAAAIASGATFTCALVALFWTLKRGTVSRVIPMIGAVFPVATLALAAAVVGERLSGQETVAFAVLLVSGILLSASTEESEKGRIGVTIAGSVLAGFLLALAFVLAKYVFSHHAFLSGFIWMRVAGGATALSFLLVPSWRRTILSASAKPEAGIVLLIGLRAIAGFSFVLVNYAVKLGSVTLVNALKGIEYGVVFIFTVFLSHCYPAIIKESPDKKIVAAKSLGIAGIAFGLWLLAL